MDPELNLYLPVASRLGGVDFFPERQALTPRSLKKQLCGPKVPAKLRGGIFWGLPKSSGFTVGKEPTPSLLIIHFFGKEAY